MAPGCGKSRAVSSRVRGANGQHALSDTGATICSDFENAPQKKEQNAVSFCY
jgi:hypothetical protein